MNLNNLKKYGELIRKIETRAQEKVMKEIGVDDLQLDVSKQQYIHDTGMKDYITGVINGNISDAVVTTWLYELQTIGNLCGIEVGKTGEDLHRQLGIITGQIMEQEAQERYNEEQEYNIRRL